MIEIEDAIYAWINGILGMAAVFAYPNADRPATSYVLINVLSNTQNGTKESDGNETPVYSSFNQITVSVNTYYDGAFQKAIDIKNSLMRIDVNESLWGSGLGYVSATQTQKIPEEINKRWEERAQFDIVFNIRETTDSENIGQIETVELTNEVDETTTIIGES